MVGVPRISFFYRGVEPCIIMLMMPTIMLTMLTITLILLISMLMMLTVKLITSIARTTYLIIPRIQ